MSSVFLIILLLIFVLLVLGTVTKCQNIIDHSVTTAMEGLVSLAPWTDEEQPTPCADHSILIVRLFLNNGLF